MDDEERALTVRITGRVQGVGFRAWTLIEAGKLDIRGWVRNEHDGSVTALIAGSGPAVAAMLEQLRQGPAGAVVADIATAPADAAPRGFRITS
ncbi:acylphosphatase [Mesorhizobium albiziae]|uniref:Acylphosphatase n=1 Tax=Neomesorhizobium albiziae TaxID=335020 RepID=A0A1I4BHQ9_9HYPH|nr:acylphosphatase [Mesorhizobium albiziae]GLS29872.1 acylphosphatase [Mesorhizobium albiziae]SFK67830.1 acylphosphatase [Mesorhizobium albiziae]